MALEPLGESLITPDLRVPDPGEFRVIDYDRDEDTLFVGLRDAPPAIAEDVEDVWVRVDPVTHTIVGLEVEGFERVFLSEHPALLRFLNDDTTAASGNRAFRAAMWLLWWVTATTRAAAVAG